ncbi:MAG: (2Fe-2S) ferredoxin domain-containing protein [Anaerolineae bacterium]|nr:(2Fe-2S) ferredoxin domain-containing protein [Anaerolineae bacterium]
MFDRVRIVVCRGIYCNEGRRADHLLKALGPLLEAHQTGTDLPQVKVETANCLSMCGAGPNLII